MRALLGDLDALGEVSDEQLRRDRFRRHVTERVLSALVDLAVGVNSHVLAARQGALPRDAAATFDAVAVLGVLDEDLAERLRGSVGLRNAIVPEYADVDLAVVAAAVPIARREYARYVRSVAAWVTGAGEAG
jgi:uncharacterized protein YutE (UPF0331/DUF86 family)